MPICLEPNNYSLAIHTTSPELGLALSNFENEFRSQTWDLGRDLSTHFHHYLAQFIQPQTWQNLAFIAVAKGPGSFTGTRIGVVTARTLAQQLNIPLYPISSLAAVAWSTPGIDENTSIAVQMPAQRGQIFAAIYQLKNQGLIPLSPDRVMSPEVWQETLTTWATPYHLIQLEAGIGLGTSVDSLLKLAYLDWQQGKYPNWSAALPFYGQHPVENTP